MLFSCNGSLISPTVLIALFTSADLKVDWTGLCLHSTQRINVGHFHWNDSQFQPMMVFLCMCPNDMNLQGDEKTCKIPQIIPQGKCFLEPLILISSMLPQISFKSCPPFWFPNSICTSDSHLFVLSTRDKGLSSVSLYTFFSVILPLIVTVVGEIK